MRWMLLAGIWLLATACGGGSGNWTKSGADSAAVQREYDDCRSLATTAVRTDVDIDHDIAATRNADTQRSGVVRAQTQTMQEHSRDRAGSIIERCMAAKGYAKAP